MANTWTNASGDNNWWDSNNWYDSDAVWVNGSSTNHYVPQDVSYKSVLISGTSGSPATVNYAATTANSSRETTALQGVEVGAYATLNVTGTNGTNEAFSTHSLTIDANGTVNINTKSPVTLGSSPTVNGVLHLTSTVASISSNSVTGSGTLILDGTTLGSTSNMFSLGSSLTTVLENNATVYVNNASAGKAIQFADNTASALVLNDHQQTVSTQIIGFNKGSVIHINNGNDSPTSAKFTLNSDGKTYTLVIGTNSGGNNITFSNVSLADGVSASDLTITTNASGGWDVTWGQPTTTCFLAGSMILTSEGEKAVEDLRIGDTVVAFDPKNGALSSRAIIWAGQQRTTVRQGMSHDVAGYPVRILKDAIEPNIPSQDLLVTPEHCLFLNGQFVPVRMLVNGRSIAYDLSITSYDYFHIETADHSVIAANGLLTESFLNTGHRSTFMQRGNVVSIGDRTRTWSEDAAAPLATDRATVEPLFRSIAGRAEAAGVETTTPDVALTAEAGLHLVAEDGTVIRKMRETNGYAMFMLPQNVHSVRLMSRTSRPADVVGPFVDDRRQLGVLVGKVTLYDAGSTTDLTAHLSEETLSGWSTLEGPTARWTTGNAEIQLTERPALSIAMLGVQILSASQYIVADESQAAARTA